MLHVDLNDEEKELLSEVLDSYIGDLRYEIGDTDSKDYRDRLKAKEQLLKKIRASLDNV